MRHDLVQSVSDYVLAGNAPVDRTVLWDGRAFTLGDLRADAGRLASALQAAGAGNGSVVCLCARHGHTYLTTLLACRVIGAPCVLTNPTASDSELKHVLDNAGIELLVGGSDCSTREVFQDWRVSDVEGVALLRRKLRAANPPGLHRDARVVIYTSGTSGLPKGVVLSERGISTNAWAVVEYLGLGPPDRSVVYTPSGYVYALSQSLTHLAAGAFQVAYPHGLRFPRNLLEEMQAQEVTGVATNPIGLRAFTDSSVGTIQPLSRVRYVMTGGQPLSPELLARTRARFPSATVINTYGCTETSARVSCWVCPSDLRGMGAPLPVGHAVTGVRVRIVDEQARSVPDGEIGEVLVKGAGNMLEYLGCPEVTTEAMPDGWFRTRDRGRYSDSYGLVLCGRVDDVILVGHEKVGPEEVELVLDRVEGVREAVAVGRPADVTGEVVVALLVVEGDSDTVIPACRAACLAGLSSAKRPKDYRVVAKVPRTLYGKLDRKKAKIMWEASDGSRAGQSE